MRKALLKRRGHRLRLAALLGGVLAAVIATAVLAQDGPVPAPAQVPEPPPVTEPTDQLAGGAWRWLRSEYGDGSTVVALDPNRYTIAFRPDQTLAMRLDCNQAGGTYIVQGSRLALHLGPSTLIGCPSDSQVDIFTRDLLAVASYVFDGQQLVLNLKLDSGNMIFERQPVAALAQTHWRVHSYNNGRGGVTSVLPDTELTAVFSPDGQVAGSAGCNSFFGPYALEGDQLSFGPLASTRRGCEPRIMEQEHAFLAALEATASYTLTHDRLILRSATGATQVVFVVAG